MQYICKICGEIFESNNDTINGQKCAISKKFKKHLKEKHNLTLEQYILKIYFNNEIPKCHCGCGKLLKFTPKNALWDPLNSYGKFINCGHVGRNNNQLKSKLKDLYKSRYDNIDKIKKHYYQEYGKENIENSAIDFLNDDKLTNIDISKKYGIDIRTLKNIWFKLSLVSKEQWEERSKYRKYNLSSKRRKKKFENKEVICAELFDIMKNHPLKYNINSLIKYYNNNNLYQIQTNIPVILNELEKIYGNQIYNYLNYGFHSKEEKNFLFILKFFLKKYHHYKCGLSLQYGKNKRQQYIYDICIDNKYIIEYDGIYFHNENSKQRDLEKEKFAKDKGYKIIRISSKDFKNIDIYKQIINFIEND